MSNIEESMPEWDVALAALAQDAYERKNDTPLTLTDFHDLARQHAIRFDDIMETMFQLVIHDQWTYTDESGEPQALDQDTLDKLYVKRRLSEADLGRFNGNWQPA